ncbi:MFS transporter [Streptomyces corchorusii]|uniref:MFS transporter n=2 Tax=Streptomyces TaxID=1883 RepID=A0A117QIX2_STRCK|nr:MFS transporter [Streptomyces corchorusii]AEY93403.1 major facilitator superfamily permease [Streptomyces hygroscopicus subsp. jinggangensis 5008]AGF67561.1 major facilitator superfamily permease [Streptomyces hygroscopicus subsp. jinggangensis TL01]KUN30869.1 MFS transporter [Streptomyces corchorusii]
MIPRLTARARTAGPSPAGFDRRLIPPMVLGSVLNPVNSSMIAVALVPIGVAFGAPPAETVWLVSALYVATAVGQPVIGRLVDMYGPRRLYLAGTALVGVAGLLGALAPSLGALIAARVLLGLGTSAAYPAAMRLTRAEAERTGQDSPAGVLTALAVANQTVAVVGPALGGLLIQLGGWRAVFTVNVPLSAACLVLGALRLPRSATRRRGLDVPGMALFAVLLVALMLFLMEPRAGRWYLPVLSAVAAAGFALRELRVPDPFIDLRVLGGNGPLLATYLRQLLGYTTAYAFMYGYTQWLEQGRGLGASTAGLALLPLSAAALTASALTGRREAVRAKLVCGSVLQLAGCAVLLLIGDRSPFWLLLGVGVLLGVPQGLIGLATQTALYRQAEPERIASAAGLLRTFMYLGALGASAATAAFYPHRADTTGLHGLALFMLAGSALLLATTLPDRSLGRLTPRDTRKA